MGAHGVSSGVGKPGPWTHSRKCCELQCHSGELWRSGPAVLQRFYLVVADVLSGGTCVVQAVRFMPCLEPCWHHPGRLPWALGVPLEKLMVMTVAGIHTGPLPHSGSLLCLFIPERCFVSINSQGCSTFPGWTGRCGWSSRLTRGSGCVTHPVVATPGHRPSSLQIVAVAAGHVLKNASSRASSAGKWEVLGQASLSSAVARASRGRAVSPAPDGVTQNAQCGQTLPFPQRALLDHLFIFILQRYFKTSSKVRGQLCLGAVESWGSGRGGR